jgi:hypothetical protein
MLQSNQCTHSRSRPKLHSTPPPGIMTPETYRPMCCSRAGCHGTSRNSRRASITDATNRAVQKFRSRSKETGLAADGVNPSKMTTGSPSVLAGLQFHENLGLRPTRTSGGCRRSATIFPARSSPGRRKTRFSSCRSAARANCIVQAGGEHAGAGYITRDRLLRDHLRTQQQRISVVVVGGEARFSGIALAPQHEGRPLRGSI